MPRGGANFGTAGSISGPPPKPAAVREAEGDRSHGVKTAWKNEPKSPKVTRVPRAPSHLGKYGKAEWAAICKAAIQLKVLCESDLNALAAVAMAYQELREAHQVIAKMGATYETTTAAGSVMQRKRPECELRQSAWNRYMSGLAHFGLTPATRVRLAETSGDSDSDFDAFRRGSDQQQAG